MTLTNYREIGREADSGAGFQFEFHCESCSHTWKSAFKPYRKGQISELIYKFAYFLGDRGSLSRTSSTIASAGAKSAKEAALQEALIEAEQRYVVCPGCEKAVCDNCWDARAKRCEQCAQTGSAPARAGGNAAGGANCPNCKSPLDGGRFCAECGFDMASTHKSCPGCGTLCARAARFCTDCGHGF
jgi:hypothetical protein